MINHQGKIFIKNGRGLSWIEGICTVKGWMDAVLYPASWKDEILHPPNFQFILHPYYSNSSKRNKKLPLHAQKIISNVDMNLSFIFEVGTKIFEAWSPLVCTNTPWSAFEFSFRRSIFHLWYPEFKEWIKPPGMQMLPGQLLKFSHETPYLIQGLMNKPPWYATKCSLVRF